jgi:drug/metabolite transporter (DMT)-like permease
MRKSFLQLHAAVLIAGFTGILGRLIELNEGWLVWYRLLISAATLWILYFFLGKLKKLSIRDWLLITGTGCIAALHWVTFYGSIKYANVSVAVVCFSAIGFFTAIFEPVILRKKIKWTECMLGVLAIAGIAIIFHFDPQYKTGILIGILSALLGSIFPIFNGRFVKRLPVETVTLYELTGGFLCLTLLLPLYLQLSPATTWIPTWSDWAWLLVLSWICTVLAFHLSMNALKKISAFTVNLSFNLEPLYTIILAFIIFQENKELSSGFFIGLSLIVLSVLLQTLIVTKAKHKVT